ncbi:unnamed protein product [Acanthoscelides obtectus]|uniref:acid phosphatase n=1 Tax=Acanthoscelides obtectus TaxID=200917 RepID=A0A9P0QBS3_ACAOB|nr:unnamed protein product [Acanthoscelides obtectus]CAK1662202.1 Testicular acid phosphatase homolog [Acanthoscelides obtectus]
MLLINRMLISVFIQVCICIFIGSVSAKEDDLTAVIVIYRHGDRTPIKPYPSDPYGNESFWQVGFGQLTNRGKQQQKELGQWLRQRYDNFLPKEYSEKDIYVRSTDVDRTLMSAEANLAGLYPPTSSQMWDTNLKWQPIPVHTMPEREDALLAGKKPCAQYEMLLKKLLSSDYFRYVSFILLI